MASSRFRRFQLTHQTSALIADSEIGLRCSVIGLSFCRRPNCIGVTLSKALHTFHCPPIVTSETDNTVNGTDSALLQGAIRFK